jgi:hypothetical protein
VSVSAVFALVGAASVSFSTASGEDVRPNPVSVDVCGLADRSAGVALLGRGDVLAACACLFEGVEEAAVAERRDQAGAGDAQLQRLPLLRGDVSFAGHDSRRFEDTVLVPDRQSPQPALGGSVCPSIALRAVSTRAPGELGR